MRRLTVWLAILGACAMGAPAGLSTVAASAAPGTTGWTAYASIVSSGALTPFNTATDAVGTPTSGGGPGGAIAITPDGQTAYQVNDSAGTVTPIDLATGSAGPAISVGSNPQALAITPDGATVYVANAASDTVTPIATATNTPGTPIPVPDGPYAVAVSPDGQTAYVVNGDLVTPIDTATNTTGPSIQIEDADPRGVAIAPDGRMLYVTEFEGPGDVGGNDVQPINLATGTVGSAIPAGPFPLGIAITPDGSTAYVADFDNGSTGYVTPINLATDTAEPAITVADDPRNVAITPDGSTVLVDSADGVTPISTSTNVAGSLIPIAGADSGIAVTPDQAPTAAFTVTPAPAGQASSFDGSASFSPVGTVASYQWNFGDGQSSTTTSPLTTHTYAQAGTYTASLTVTNSTGTSLTTEVFTGQTVSREGGPQAESSHAVAIAAASTVTPAPTPTARLSVPTDVSLPFVSGSAKVGHQLTCSSGDWTNAPTRYAYQWSRDGTPIQGATAATYSVRTIDEQLRLTCTVTAANATGSGPPAVSRGVAVSVPKVKGCPAASGGIRGSRLGLAKLGMTRAQARRAYTHSSTRGYTYEDFFCLTPIGIRVGYGSPKLTVTLGKRVRSKYADRVIWASTSSGYYAIRGVRPGATLAAARRRIRLTGPFHIGLNDWYLAADGTVTAVFKVRHGIVEEIGIGAQALTRTHRDQETFLHSFT